MGQKTHPLGFRVNITQDHQSDWVATTNHYPLVVMEDCFIRQFLFQEYFYKRITTIKIKRELLVNRIMIEITTPESFQTKKDCRRLKSILQSKIKLFRAHNLYLNRSSNKFKIIENQELLGYDYRLDVIIEYKLLCHKYLSASFFADMLMLQFESRTRYRKALHKVLKAYNRAESDPNLNVGGIKIQVSGRINGKEIARTEWIQRGRVPLHTLRADIDYSSKTAKTIHGILGIKVWLFREEIITYKKSLKYTKTKAREVHMEVSSEIKNSQRRKYAVFAKDVILEPPLFNHKIENLPLFTQVLMDVRKEKRAKQQLRKKRLLNAQLTLQTEENKTKQPKLPPKLLSPLQAQILKRRARRAETLEYRTVIKRLDEIIKKELETEIKKKPKTRKKRKK